MTIGIKEAPTVDATEAQENSNDCTTDTLINSPNASLDAENSGSSSDQKVRISTNSTNSTPPPFTQRAIYPEDSIISDFMEYGRTQTEGADAFLIASIIPIAGAILARNVYVRFGPTRKYPNLFAMIVAKPGDRKSSTIKLGEKIAKYCLPQNAFLPKSLSAETLFDEYCEDVGGRPDKLCIAGEANIILSDWKNTGHGERVSQKFLELYDCESFSENFRRNLDRQSSSSASGKRYIEETSTSLLFGATFNIATFQGHGIRSGLERRFLYYVAEHSERVITWPEDAEEGYFQVLCESFRELQQLRGSIILDERARTLWDQYQIENRDKQKGMSVFDEAESCRLSSAPMQTLAIAQIFETSRWAKEGKDWAGKIRKDTLQLAIDHVDECLRAAAALDSVTNREQLRIEADTLLARVQSDFKAQSTDGWIEVSKSQLTSKYAPHGNARKGWTTNDLYFRIIPMLEKLGKVQRIKGGGKTEWFRFQADAPLISM